MYKQCDRCRFNVPVKNTLCHVCGSKTFIELKKDSAHHSLQAIASAGANVGNGIKDGASHFFGQLRELSGSYISECCALGGKAISAAAKMKSLAVASQSSHDEILSLHRTIRRDTVQVSRENPVTAASSEPPETARMAAPPMELEVALKADVETLKQNLDDLKNWFENYGKESTILAGPELSERGRRAA